MEQLDKEIQEARDAYYHYSKVDFIWLAISILIWMVAIVGIVVIPKEVYWVVFAILGGAVVSFSLSMFFSNKAHKSRIKHLRLMDKRFIIGWKEFNKDN